MAAAREECAASTPKIVCFFAHKGGVSKTTNVYHLGWMLASQFDQRIVLVDADPQCNLTHTLMRDARFDTAWGNDVEQQNLFSSIKPVHSGQRPPHGSLLPAKCFEVEDCVSVTGEGKLYLLPGSLELSTLEPQLTLAHNVNCTDSFALLNNVAGAFHNLLLATGTHYRADLVLVDMGPSIGSLNLNLFLSSDFFVVPCSPDAYCRSAVLTMNAVLPKWAATQARLAEVTKDQDFPVKPQRAKFLGIIFSLFNVAGKYHKPIKQSQVWMETVSQELMCTLLPTLEELNMSALSAPASSEQEEESEESCAVLGKIPNFLQLMPLSQRASRPVFCIPEGKMTDIDADGCMKTMSKAEKQRNLERAARFEVKYREMAEEFLMRVLHA